MAVLGSVVPSATQTLADTLEQIVGEAPIVVDARSPLPIRLDVDEPLTVGADRIVNTLAAKEMYGRDTIAVDLGTATTFDCITADGVFVGGVIAQGLQSGLEWLGRKTAKLPRVGADTARERDRTTNGGMHPKAACSSRRSMPWTGSFGGSWRSGSEKTFMWSRPGDTPRPLVPTLRP